MHKTTKPTLFTSYEVIIRLYDIVSVLFFIHIYYKGHKTHLDQIITTQIISPSKQTKYYVVFIFHR